MKKILVMTALALSLTAQARDWGRVLKAISYVESKNNPKGNVERAIRLWNGGSGYTIRGTQKYYVKVKKAMR